MLHTHTHTQLRLHPCHIHHSNIYTHSHTRIYQVSIVFVYDSVCFQFVPYLVLILSVITTKLLLLLLLLLLLFTILYIEL